MFLIVGLGNPGSKYIFTRHNVGFLALEHCLELYQKAGGDLANPKKEHKSVTWKLREASSDVLFVEPQTFMNVSGEAVQSLMAFYKVPLENILIVYDDLDLPVGKIKFMKNRGAGGHNGIKSVTEKLGTPDYARLKIGVGGPRHPGQSGGDYVLENFREEELKSLQPLFDKCFDAIKSFVNKGYERTANVYNQREPEPKNTENE